MVLNVGGIANLSLLLPGTPVRGFDTGPGNMLMDAQVWRHRAQPYDQDGGWAMQGRVCLPLLQQMLADPYFALPAPKAPAASILISHGWSGSWPDCRRWRRSMCRPRSRS